MYHEPSKESNPSLVAIDNGLIDHSKDIDFIDIAAEPISKCQRVESQNHPLVNDNEESSVRARFARPISRPKNKSGPPEPIFVGSLN